ncbi:Uncharacterized protein GcM3_082004 [Golovinomyces cichoracearum]|uniref:Transcription factor tau 55 kDa subunit n=1 Tax=Golovinomyces cichoracearum TaxID=62708 RepID=A0A420IMS7_9PEZI|nr:Uncharacterized protein GcM3_082004 [Golovinomyces cichoracearum]
MSLKTIKIPFQDWHLLVPKFRSNWVVDPQTGDYSTNIPCPTGIAIDPALASYGIRQSHELATHLRTLSPPIERIYSSPFYRCLQTVTPTYNALSSSETVADPSVFKIRGETGLGEWHGTARFDHPSPAEPEILKKHFPHYDEKYQAHIKPNITGETIAELHDRCAYAMDKIIKQSDQEGVEAILISTHAAPLIAIGRALTGRMPEDVTEEDFRPFTCGLSTFVRQKPQNSGSEVQEEEVINSVQIPRITWKNKNGVGGSCWEIISNGDCSFLSGGEERGWKFSGEESFMSSNSSSSLDAGTSLGVVTKKKIIASDFSML